MEGKPRVVAIVQARLGSSRFAGKVLAEIEGEPMLWHVIRRARAARSLDEVVVAAPAGERDEPIAEFCAARGIALFRGAEHDVLDRYLRAAESFGAGTIVRLTADCPLVDPELIDEVCAAYAEGGSDYATNARGDGAGDGFEVEVFSLAALRSAWKEARAAADREHVTSYFRSSGRYRVREVPSEAAARLAGQRWSVDEPEDLEAVRALFARLGGGRIFGWREVAALLEREPALARRDGPVVNEGYYRSLAAEPPLPPRPRRLQRSTELKAKAERLIPSCTQTFSKGPSQYVEGVAPLFLERASGCRVWDPDGNEYIDYPMALGAVILGHAYPRVSEAVKRQIEDGTIFSLPHRLEAEVAERVAAMVPAAEMVRFGKNGSDATAGAVRLARAYTGRELIACCGYHGWQDWYIGTTTRRRGVPEAVRRLTLPFRYNDIASLERIFAENPGRVAAVILEPVGVEEPRDGFLEKVEALARREGALLVFDEVITGFRLARGGAQERYGIVPDLVCLGKALANGYPLSAVAGPRELMRLFDEVFFSFTFGGDTVALAAARATLDELVEKDVPAQLWEQGRRLKDGYNALARRFGLERRTRCVGLPPRTAILFEDGSGGEALELRSLFIQECIRRGVLVSSGHNLSFSHGRPEIDWTLRVYRSALEILAEAIAEGSVSRRLEGKPVEPVFRRA